MIQMPPVRYGNVNGLKMAYYEAGPRTGMPVIFCHGFPEIAFSWRHQIKALAEAGYWVVAPDQRGYGLTKGPAEVEAYDMATLTADLIGLADHLGVERAIWCGHDWGGIVGWQIPLRYPDRVAGMIGVNTPFFPNYPIDPIEFFRQRFGEENYIVHFHKPGEADAVLNRDPETTLRFFMRLPPKSPEPHFSSQPEAGKSRFALIKALDAYKPDGDPRSDLLSKDELAVFVEAFRQSGFTGGVNWYRNFTRNWKNTPPGMPQRVLAPSLMIMAELDAVLPPAMCDGMEAYVPDLEKVLIAGSGHWTQQEKPAEVNAALLSWLGRRFPAASAS